MNLAKKCQTYWVYLLNANIEVPRDEFFVALKHFGKASTKELYLDAEEKYDEVFVAIPVLRQEYAEAMYKEGRAFSEKSTIHQFRPRAVVLKELK